jgi:holo-ACP synthase
VTVQLLTLSDKSANNFLEARDRRQDALSQALSKGCSATLFLSLNIPGHEKTPPGSEALFLWVLDNLAENFPGRLCLAKTQDDLGPYAILALDVEPREAKKRCVILESVHPSARLVDLDVYDINGQQIDRRKLGLSGRSCLVCRQPAVECIRVKRHSFDEIIGKVHELLTYFRA